VFQGPYVMPLMGNKLGSGQLGGRVALLARQVPNQPTVVLCGWEAVVAVVLVAMLPLVLLLEPPVPVLPVLLRVSPSYWSRVMACGG
jgi:hypothetical protein